MRALFGLTFPIAMFGACTLEADDHVSTATSASHAWGDYHWARTADRFPLPTIESVTADWEPYFTTAVADWSSSGRLDLVAETGDESNKTRRQCRAPEGKVRVCNLAYGQTGWLGIAGITLDANHHIVKGYTKLNDTYFGWSYYNTADWKQSVMCQELGHDIGLDHQDEVFDNQSLFTCMDYQDPPYPSPNAHDYDQLDVIYGHLDAYNTYDDGTGGDGGGGDTPCNAPPGKGCNKPGAVDAPGWGVSLGRRGHHETFARTNPDGTVEITYVLWVAS